MLFDNIFSRVRNVRKMHSLRTVDAQRLPVITPALLGPGATPGGDPDRLEPGVTPLSTRKNKNPTRFKTARKKPKVQMCKRPKRPNRGALLDALPVCTFFYQAPVIFLKKIFYVFFLKKVQMCKFILIDSKIYIYK